MWSLKARNVWKKGNGSSCSRKERAAAAASLLPEDIALPEIALGIIPGWGGCKEMLLRFSQTLSPLDAAKAAFTLIAGAKTSGSAFEARSLGLIRSTDRVTMNRERLIADAVTGKLDVRAAALAMLADESDGEAPPLEDEEATTAEDADDEDNADVALAEVDE